MAKGPALPEMEDVLAALRLKVPAAAVQHTFAIHSMLLADALAIGEEIGSGVALALKARQCTEALMGEVDSLLANKPKGDDEAPRTPARGGFVLVGAEE